MKLKVCGMKYHDNVIGVADLQPDYMGFIFYDKSPRNFVGNMPEIPKSIHKVGVFVNASLEEVIDKVNRYGLQAVQLHGEETPEYCIKLRHSFAPKHRGISGLHPDIIKVFSIKDEFDFKVLQPYEMVCDYFLFDTKGKNPGGNGYTFNWNVLENYPSTKPYFLSGGIGLESKDKLDIFFKSNASKYCEVLDINSRFEIEPALKDIEQLKEFKKGLF
ncbi:phosphoribosylanthranilate isomerase [Aureibaculum sp. A20]|uniref:N-(5'-phosphoribosyl)anthranilate isomerase n=1 Tax=Aureibaculum flavum TaxID=2795986 RepID=A0ABS0WPB9_9FLAO|nr:phosphoribosylanthranilate isomerase [Aureibaculum flavum]MBJ2173812.1 phosphoribosylanthranilate isomerase [Aureibaculum flavum]